MEKKRLGKDGSVLPQTREYYAEHFIERLQKRYLITLTVEEFEKLSKIEIGFLYRLSTSKTVGVLNIKGREVIVVKDNSLKVLNTALRNFNEKFLWPCPKPLKDAGLTTFEFNITLRNVQFIVAFLKKQFVERGYTAKDWMINKPFNFPSLFYGHVLSTLKPEYGNKKLHFHHLVNLVYELLRTNKTIS